MTTLLATVTAGTVLLTLLAGCAAHLSRPQGLPEALRAHRVLSPRAVPVIAVAVPGAEGLLGVAGSLALLTDARPALPLVLGAAAALFAGYAGYARRVLDSGRSVPCGCARSDLPMSGWTAGRATVLALAAATGAVLLGPAGAAPPTEWAHVLTAALATAAFALLLWILPAAMSEATSAIPEGASGPSVAPPARRTGTHTAGGPQWTS